MAVPLTSAMQTQIANLYISILGRNPDPVGFGYWCDAYANANGTQTALDAIASGFGKSPEFTGIYSGQTVANAVALMYNNILGRTQDAAGATYWQGIANGYITSGKTIGDAYALTANAMITAAAANTGTADATLIASKQATAVTAGTSAPVTTYTLGTAVESLNVGNNAVVNGLVDYGGGQTISAGTTLNAGDSLVGGTGNTLNVTLNNAGVGAVVFPGASITGIQTYNVRNVSGQTASLDASTVTGLTAFNSNLSTNTVTVTNLASGASAGVTGNGALTNGAFNAGYAAAASAAILNLSNGVTAGAITLSGTGLVNQTINSTGAANTAGGIALAATVTGLTINSTTALTTGALTNTGGGNALTTITSTGAGALTIASIEAGVTRINSSTATGVQTISLSTNQTITVTGGSGNDVITTGAVLTTGSVDAGSGSGDVLSIGTNVGHVNTTALAAKYTNFEILRLNGSMDMSLFPTFTAVQISGNGNNVITNMTATQAAAVTARATMGANTFTLANSTGTSDVLSINFLGTTATSAAPSAGIITATGFETINLTSSPGASIAAGAAGRTTTVTGAIVDTSLTAVNLRGTAFVFTDITSTKAVAWDASALTGDGAAVSLGLTIQSTSGSFAGSVITGSSFRDTVTMETSTGITLNLGDGNDIVSTTAALLTPSGASTDNTVNAGAGTSDQLIFTGGVTATDTTFMKTSGFETLQLAGGANNFSLTGLAAGFLNAFATGVTVTDAADQANAQSFTWSSGLYNQNVTITHTTLATGTATTSNQSITTGGGNDSITLSAANWTGSGVASVLSVDTGSGNDTIVVTTGTLVTTHTTQSAIQINGGAGQDTITVTHTNGTAATTLFANAQFIIGAGASSTTAWDTITGFLKADNTNVSDHLDFATVGVNAYAATAASGFTSAQLTVAVSGAGLVTFAGTSAAGLSVQDQINAVQSVVTNANGDTCFWINNGNTYVFNNATAGDSVVQLIAQTGATSLITTNAVTNNAIFVA